MEERRKRQRKSPPPDCPKIHLKKNKKITIAPQHSLKKELTPKFCEFSFYSPKIEIKDRVNIGQNCHITAANLVSIGIGVNILPQVLITDIEHNHEAGKSAMDTGLTVGSVIIEDYAFIGMGAKIIGSHGVRIGRSAVIGANAVVTKDVPERAIVAGVPAIVIGEVPIT